MASPDVIRIHSDGRWPVSGFTLADDISMAAVHDIDHQAGRSFAFVLLTPHVIKRSAACTSIRCPSRCRRSRPW